MKELLSKERYCYRIHASSVKGTAYPPSIGNSLYMDYPPIFIRKSSSFLLWWGFFYEFVTIYRIYKNVVDYFGKLSAYWFSNFFKGDQIDGIVS